MYQSQFIEMFCSRDTTPVGNYIEDSYPGEWGTEDKDGGGVKVIRTTNFTNTGKLDLADVVTRSIIEKKIERKTIHKYDTILERSGGTTDNPVGRVVLFEEDDVYLCNNFTQVLRFKNIDPRFAFYSLFYFYQTNKTAIRAMGNKTTGIQNLNMSKYLEIGIPNASEDEQHKFVLIAQQADKSKFSGLKSQFIEMFGQSSLDNGIIGDYLLLKAGKAMPADRILSSKADGMFPCFGGNGIRGYVDSYNYDGDYAIIGRQGALCGNVCLAQGKFYATEHAVVVTPKAIVDSTWLFFALNQMNLNQYARGVAQPGLAVNELEKLPFSVPDINKQIEFSIIAKQADKSLYLLQ